MRYLTCLLLLVLTASAPAQISEQDQSAIEAVCRKRAELHSAYYMHAEFDVQALGAVQSPQLVTMDSLRQIGWILEDVPRPEEPVILFDHLEVTNDTARCYFRNPEGEPHFANVEDLKGWKVVGYFDQKYDQDYMDRLREYIEGLVAEHTQFADYQVAVDAFGNAYNRFLETGNPAELQGIMTPDAAAHIAASHAWNIYEDPEGAEPWPGMKVVEINSAEGYVRCKVVTDDGDRSSLLLKPQRENTYLVAGPKGRLSRPSTIEDLQLKLARAQATEPLRAHIGALNTAITAYFQERGDSALKACATPDFVEAVRRFTERLGEYTPRWMVAQSPKGTKHLARDIEVYGDSAVVSEWQYTLVLARQKDTWVATNLLDKNNTPLGPQSQLTHFAAFEALLGVSYSPSHANEPVAEPLYFVEETEVPAVEWDDVVEEMPPPPEMAEPVGPVRKPALLSRQPVPEIGWNALVNACTAQLNITSTIIIDCTIERDGALGDINVLNAGGHPDETLTQLIRSTAPTWSPGRYNYRDSRATSLIILYPTP